MKYILYTIAFIFIFLPLQFALSPTEGFDVSILRVGIVLIFLIFITISLGKRKLFIPRGWTSFFLTSFLLWTFFSFFYSPVIHWTARKVLFFLTLFPLFYVLTAIFVNNPKSILFMLRSAVIGGGVAAIIGIVQFSLQFILPLGIMISLWGSFTPFFLGGAFSEAVITYNSWLVHVGGHDVMRAIAFFPDPHMYSFYLGMCAFLALGLYMQDRKIVWAIFSIIIFLADFLTFSRGGYIGIFGALFIGSIFMWHKISLNAKLFSLFFCVPILLFLMLSHNPISERFFSSFSQTDTSVTHRIELWKNAFDEIAKRPIIGTGLGAYAYTVDPLTHYRTPIYVHNLFLDIFVEIGLVGFLLFFGIITTTIRVLWSHRSAHYNIFVIMALTAFLFHSIFDTALFSLHVMPLIILIFAFAAYYENIHYK
jgi:O-antigen ligase